MYNINFERLSHDDAKYKSYKLIVSVSDYVSLCKPSQWPVGICISKYHPTEIQNYYYMVHYFLVYVSGSHTDIFTPTAKLTTIYLYIIGL